MNASPPPKRWQQWFKAFWSLFVLTAFGLLIARGLLFFTYRPSTLLIDVQGSGAVLWCGLRFDLKHLSVLMGPWLLISLLFYRASPRYRRMVTRALWVYSAVFSLPGNLPSSINHYYVAFDQGPLNSLPFAL